MLVEGHSDRADLSALAEREGCDLQAEGTHVVSMGGATSIGMFVDLLGRRGLDVRLTGLCDAAEEGDFRRGLERAGLGPAGSSSDMESLDFYVCVASLEDALVRSLGVRAVEQVLEAEGGRLRARATRAGCARRRR